MLRIMASVARKHFYRFEYLKSEHWQNLRLAKLASVDAECRRCGHRDLSNDIHHLRYRKLYDVEMTDLIVLCRSCHAHVHASMDAAREAIDSGIPLQVAMQKAFLDAWGKNPSKFPELWSVAKEIRTMKCPVIKKGREEKSKERHKREFKEALKRTIAASCASIREAAKKEWKRVKKERKKQRGPMPPEVRSLFAALRKVGFFKPSDS